MPQLHEPPSDVRDILLMDVAVRIQLSPSNYRVAVERVETLANWLDREGSELAGRISLVYPQGSMAINATIASCLKRDDFDIDAIVQLDLDLGTAPGEGLDMLFRSIRGEERSRYYSITFRNTRCVTVEYADMHVDLTPAELIPCREPRVSHIFHHRPEDSDAPGERIVANPYGFAHWFESVIPRAATFEKFFEARSRAMDSVLMKAETEAVPQQIPAYLKPPVVVTLQLIKRFRNVQYEKRTGRRPPSVLLACLLAESGMGSDKPFDELLRQARYLADYFDEHQARKRLVHVVNPTCPEDVFSDRWPASFTEQEVFIADLRFLEAQLERLERGADLETIADVFSRLFGEEVSQSVIRKFADRTGQAIASGSLVSERASGRVDLDRSGIVAAIASTGPTTSVRASPRHTFYGPSATDGPSTD
jgi:hypothetical protein